MTTDRDGLLDQRLREAFADQPRVIPGSGFRARVVAQARSEEQNFKARRAINLMRAYWLGTVFVSALVLYSLSVNPAVVETYVAVGVATVALVFAIPVVLLGRGTLSSLLLRSIGQG